MSTVLEGYVLACRVDELPPRGKKTVDLNGKQVLIIVSDAGKFAVEDRCPQTNLSLAHGEVIGHILASPHTGAHYNMRTGQYVGGGQSPLQSHWLPVFPLLIVEDQVYVRL